MWGIHYTTEIKKWLSTIDDDALKAVLKAITLLSELGPNLHRPYVDVVQASKYKNMKELRIQNKKRIFRIFFIFDVKRNALLLVGGDKRGKEQFYERMIKQADAIYTQYLMGVL